MKRAGTSLLSGVLSLASTLSQPLPATLGSAAAWTGGVILACVLFACAGYFYLVDLRGWGPRAK